MPADAPVFALTVVLVEPEVVEELPPLFAGLLKDPLLVAFEVPAGPAEAYCDEPALLEAPLLVLALVEEVPSVAAPVSAAVVRNALLWVEELDAALVRFALCEADCMLVSEALLLALVMSAEVALAAELRVLPLVVMPLLADDVTAELVLFMLPTMLEVSFEALLVLNDWVLSLVVFAPCR